MAVDVISIALRVIICCFIFAFFLFVPFHSRFRYSYGKTALLAMGLIAVTAIVTVLFLTSGLFFYHFSSLGIILWLVCAIAAFRLAIRGSSYEILFIVLIVLNLYVNIVAIAKVIGELITVPMDSAVEQLLLVTAVLIAYLPFLWILMVRLYRQVIEFNMNLPFWRYIWAIPALTYMIFYVKIINDYWKRISQLGAGDVIFIILWSFTSYAFFYVTLQMLVQAYKGATAMKQAEFAASQQEMQREQYGEMLGYLERTSRLKHDWRHHLLTIEGLTEKGDLAAVKQYLQDLIPEYSRGNETPACRNHIADVILRHYVAVAKARGILMEIHADIAEELSVSDTDLCIILGNLVENAVEACTAMEDGERLILVKTEMKGSQLILMIKNTYQHEIIEKEHQFCSTKHRGMGIGLESVKHVIEKYKGQMKVDYDGNHFSVYILLQAL